MIGRPLRIGVIGLGWWGPKLVRNFCAHPQVVSVLGHDPHPDRRRAIETDFSIETTADLDALLADDRVTGVAIASPPGTHYDVARRALAAGKHVLTEKPPAMSIAELVELTTLARNRQLRYMLDATYLFSDAVQVLRKKIDSGAIGPLTLAQSLRYGDNVRRDGLSRLESAMLQNGIDAVGDLAYHDLAILHYLIDGLCTVNSISVAHNLWDGLCDTAYIDLRIGDCAIHVGLSWTLPERRRDLTLFDRKQIVVFDDLQPADKLTVHGIVSRASEPIPLPPAGEPLAAVVDHFLECINAGIEPITGGAFMTRLMTTYQGIRQHQALAGQLPRAVEV